MDSATKNFLVLIGAIVVLAIINGEWGFRAALVVGALLGLTLLKKNGVLP